MPPLRLRRVSSCLPRHSVIGLAIVVGALAVPAVAQTPHWVGTWATANVALPASGETLPAGANQSHPARLNNQTLRQIVHTSIGGTRVRVAFANTYGTKPLQLGAAHVALRDKGAAIVAGSGRPLTFGGRMSTSIEPGAILLSDPADLRVPALGDLAIDVYLPGDFWGTDSPATMHGTGLTTNHLSAAGNHSGSAALSVETTIQSWFFLSRVEVEARVGAVVALGDSITDGTASTPDTNSRWPDFLARRFVETWGDRAPGVLNLGIAGNRVLSDNAGMGIFRGRDGVATDAPMPRPDPNALFGPSARSRFDRDVLLQPGVTHVIVLESINDIGMALGAAAPTANEIIAGHRALIQRAHARGLTIHGGTLTPFEGALYYTDAGEAKRQAFNEWIRTSRAYDGVIDFDAAVRDPSHPTRLRPAYDPGDRLHLNDAGYRAMAEAIDLALFARVGPAATARANRSLIPRTTASLAASGSNLTTR